MRTIPERKRRCRRWWSDFAGVNRNTIFYTSGPMSVSTERREGRQAVISPRGYQPRFNRTDVTRVGPVVSLVSSPSVATVASLSEHLDAFACGARAEHATYAALKCCRLTL